MPTSGAFDGLDHLFPVRVYYEDTDFSGFVYHASHLKFFERARTEFLRMAGVSHTELLEHDTPLAIVVRRMEIDWRLPARIDDALLVRSRFTCARGARLGMFQRIERDGRIVAQATIDAALVAISGGPRKFPPALAAKLAPWLQTASS